MPKKVGKARGVELFGTAVLVKQVIKQLAGGLVLPENPHKDSRFIEFHVVATGSETTRVAVGDVVLFGVPSPHQMVVCDPDGVGNEQALFLIDESQIKGRIAR